jgi:hypothetical protein
MDKTANPISAHTHIAAMSRESLIKWLLLALIATTDWIWICVTELRIDPAYFENFLWIVLLSSISQFYFYTGRDQRIMEFAHFGAQLLSLYALMALLSYLAVSTDAPLVDSVLGSIDKSSGLDWVRWTEWVRAHPHLQRLLTIAYDSLPIQTLFCYVYNIHTRAFWRNSEIWWISLISVVVTIAGSAVFPATNPYVYYGLERADHFLHMRQFLGLRDGSLQVIKIVNEGLIQIPSFHTILAIMLTYNLRHNRWLFTAAVVINTALILSCPSEGSHYFVDLFAGAVVAVATIWIVRRLGRQFAWGLQPQIMAKPFSDSAILTGKLA